LIRAVNKARLKNVKPVFNNFSTLLFHREIF
jgi:hypothetical protein